MTAPTEVGAVTEAAAATPAAGGSTPGGMASGMARRLVRGASWSLVAQLLPVIIGLVMTPFLLHHLGLVRFGLYVLASTVVSFLRTFDGGLGATAIRFFSVHAGAGARDKTTRLLVSLVGVVVIVGGFVGAVFELFVPLIVRAFGVSAPLRAEGAYLMRVLIVLVVFGIATGLFGSVAAAQQRFAWLSITSVTVTITGAVGYVVVLEQGDGLRAMALVLAGQSVLGALMIIPWSLQWLDRSAVRPATHAEMREFFRYASRTQLVTLGSLVTLETDSVIVGVAQGPSSVSYYSTGAGFAFQLRQVVLNGLGPIAAQLGRSFGARGHEARAEFESLQRVWVVVVTAWCAAGLGSAYVAMTVWLGPTYGIAGVVATVLAFSNMINLWTGGDDLVAADDRLPRHRGPLRGHWRGYQRPVDRRARGAAGALRDHDRYRRRPDRRLGLPAPVDQRRRGRAPAELSVRGAVALRVAEPGRHLGDRVRGAAGSAAGTARPAAVRPADAAGLCRLRGP